jgi:hypothetical protein
LAPDGPAQAELAQEGPARPEIAPVARVAPAPVAADVASSIETDQGLDKTPQRDFWRTPIGIVLFLLLSALLYGFLDPAFGPDEESVATFAGLAVGLALTVLAFFIPIAIRYRRSAVGFSPRALPGTLGVGVVCVLLTRFTDFHPGYLYGLIVTFTAAREVSVAVEGKAMATAAASTFVLAVVAWFALWWLEGQIPADGEPGLAFIALQTGLVMALVAGIEMTVFGMLPLRFLPGAEVFRWDRRAWAVLFGAGLVGFIYVLVNPRSGYLADSARTPLLTIILCLLGFGLFSIAFWAYFRFRRPPLEPVAG